MFHFPTIDEVFDQTENSFIVGDALLVCPVLNPNVTTYNSFFPNDRNGTYVSLKNYEQHITPKKDVQGEWVELAAPADTVNVFLRPGYLIPFQNNKQQ